MAARLSIGILPREGPRDTAALGVASLLPFSHFDGEQSKGRQAPVKALAVKDSNLDLGHIEPAGVLRGVAKDDTAKQLARCVDPQHFLEADAKVGIEVVENQMDSPRLRVDVFEQVLDEGNEVDFGPALGHSAGASSTLGLHGHEQIVELTGDAQSHRAAKDLRPPPETVPARNPSSLPLAPRDQPDRGHQQ